MSVWTWTWKTDMRDDGEHPTLRGQIGMRRQPDGGAYVVVMAARGTFATDAVISAEDVRAMVAAFTPTGAEQSDKERLDDLIEQVCTGVPESWDGEESADSIIVEYVREIERRLIAAGGTLERWPDEDTEPPAVPDAVTAVQLAEIAAHTGASVGEIAGALGQLHEAYARSAPQPQRATDRRGDPLRMHMPCRQIVAESRSACRSCDEPGEWRALFTVPGA